MQTTTAGSESLNLVDAAIASSRDDRFNSNERHQLCAALFARSQALKTDFGSATTFEAFFNSVRDGNEYKLKELCPKVFANSVALQQEFIKPEYFQAVMIAKAKGKARVFGE